MVDIQPQCVNIIGRLVHMTNDLKNADGKVMIRFIHEAAGLYEDEDENVYETLHTRYQADTWQEAFNDAADFWDWDDEDVINFDAESEISETTRDLETIEYQDVNNEWVEVPAEVYEFFEKAEERAYAEG